MNREDKNHANQLARICPTRVGMNRLWADYPFAPQHHLPHTRGDEPDVETDACIAAWKSAPHAWG